MNEPNPAQAVTRRSDCAEISSTELLGSRGELKIIHNGEPYFLRITSNKKLILTK